MPANLFCTGDHKDAAAAAVELLSQTASISDQVHPVKENTLCVPVADLRPFPYPGCASECLSRARASPRRVTARTVDGFISTCVMKYIWSIKAYLFSVPFN